MNGRMVIRFNFFLLPLLSPLKSEYHTSLILFRRLGRKNIKDVTKDLGLSEMKLLNADNPYYLENLDVDELEGDEMNLMKTDMIYDEIKRESKAQKHKIGYKITAQKFFFSGKQPQMLTYNEKLCIKYLYNQDPIQWNITTLSESFPATPSIIKKVLRSNWKPTKKKILKMDQEVQNNWKLLKQGKLEGDPELIEHLKKFTNREMILLEQIKNEKFYLPEIKKEKVWNNGEMSSILKSYELSIDKLKNTNLKKLSDGSESNKSTTSGNEQNSFNALDKLNEKIEKKLQKLDVEEKESFKLDYITKKVGKLITYEKLCNNIEKKHENKENLDLYEKAILEYKMAEQTFKYPKNNSQQNLIAESNDSINTAKTNDCLNIAKSNDSISIAESDDGNNTVENESYSLYEPFLSEKNKEIRKSMELKSNRKNKFKKLKNEYHTIEERKENYIFNTGKDTKLINESQVGKILEKNYESPKLSIKSEKSSVKRFNELINQNPERAIKDELYYESEVQDIKHTCFWNGMESSEIKALRENKKNPLQAPDQNDLFNSEIYPERIKIPQNKKGSGLTYKFKDCYYDDDGEFLYRVPGMHSYQK